MLLFKDHSITPMITQQDGLVMQLPYTLTSYVIRIQLVSTRLDPPFASRTALIILGIDSGRCWKHSPEI